MATNSLCYLTLLSDRLRRGGFPAAFLYCRPIGGPCLSGLAGPCWYCPLGIWWIIGSRPGRPGGGRIPGRVDYPISATVSGYGVTRCGAGVGGMDLGGFLLPRSPGRCPVLRCVRCRVLRLLRLPPERPCSDTPPPLKVCTARE